MITAPPYEKDVGIDILVIHSCAQERTLRDVCGQKASPKTSGVDLPVVPCVDGLEDG